MTINPGRWKILHYYTKKFFAPILLSSFEVGKNEAYEVHVSNDTTEDLQGTNSTESTDGADIALAPIGS